MDIFSNKDFKVVQAQWTRGIRAVEETSIPGEGAGKSWVYLLSVLCVLAILISGGLWFYNKQLASSINQANQRIEELEKQKNQANLDQITIFAKKLAATKQLLSSHVYFSKLLEVVEKSTLPSVQWTNLNADTKNNTLNLEGYVPDWSGAARQIVALKEDGLKVTNVSKLASAREKGIGFSLKISYGGALLRK